MDFCDIKFISKKLAYYEWRFINMELKSILPARRVEKEQGWTDCNGIKGLTFVIKPYQRGYRWGRSNVRKLLDDIFTYSKSTDDFIAACVPKSTTNVDVGRYDFYCLQALSVKSVKETKDEFELIDGQQRLTTIFLLYELLDVFCDVIKKEQAPPFSIIYNRDGNLTNNDRLNLTDEIYKRLKSIDAVDGITPSSMYWSGDENRKNNNWFNLYKDEVKKQFLDIHTPEDTDSIKIDLYYLIEAMEEIIDYIMELDDSESSDDKLQKFSKVVKRNVLFLWYEIDEDISPEKEFASLNTNKIKLTNAELIKALVLRTEGIDNVPENAGHRWEQIEQGLCKNELWAFISGEDKATRIDLLLELYAGGVNNDYDALEKFVPDINNEYSLFDWYESYSQKVTDFSNNVLQGVEKIFDRISEWYDDVDIYHLIGLLTCFNGLKLKNCKSCKQEELINDIFKWYDGKNRDDFINRLKDEIREKISSGARKGNEKVYIEDIIDSYHYDDDGKNHILAILWALNAWETMEAVENNEDKNKRVPIILKRMPFSKINGNLPTNDKWTLEHIMPQKPEDSESDDNKEKYNELQKQIETEKCREELLNSDDIHDIGNMALLTRWSNSTLQNGNLQEKREDIVRMLGEGKYVPCATINVFNLYYNMLNREHKDSEDSSAMRKECVTETEYKYWTVSDRDNYLKQIKKCLRAYGFNNKDSESNEEQKEEVK